MKMTNYTREQLDQLRAELNYFGGGTKKGMADFLKAKRAGEKALKELKPEPKNFRVNMVHSIKDILGSL